MPMKIKRLGERSGKGVGDEVTLNVSERAMLKGVYHLQ